MINKRTDEYKLKVLTLENASYIKKLLRNCSEKDIHYYPNYLKLFEEYTGMRCIYVFYGNDKNYILVPYFERRVNTRSSLDSEYVDLISPWYYGGPIHNIKDEKLRNRMFQNFMRKLNEYCKKDKVISEFQCLNPILGNYRLFRNNTNKYYYKKIVYIDLSKNIKTLVGQYSRKTRKAINKAKRNGLKFYQSKNKECVSRFIKLYSEAMRRKKAEDFYHFNRKFFNNLFKLFRNEAKLFNVQHNGKIISSSLAIGKYGILQDFLRGSSPKHFYLRPNDMMIDGIIKWAKSKGYKYFDLCGGLTPSPEDSLFKFKKSFSSTSVDLYLYKKIHDLEKYKELCKQLGRKEQDLRYEKASFFPEYVEGGRLDESGEN